MDVLSEVLRAVKLDGAVFYNAEFSAPWWFSSPPSTVLAPHLLARSRHVIIFHLLTGRTRPKLASVAMNVRSAAHALNTCCQMSVPLAAEALCRALYDRRGTGKATTILLRIQ